MFAENQDEVAEGFWSEFEPLALQEVISEVNAHEEHNGIEKLYNDIVHYATSSFCSIKNTNFVCVVTQLGWCKCS